TEELDQLVEAINISSDMHLTMMKNAKAGMTESEVMAKVRSVCLEKNVDISYTIILSVNGQTLHNHSYHNTLKSGQLLLGDFGSESSMHYAGDITRTIPVDKSFTSFQKEIYSIVLNTLETCIAKVKAGIKYKDVHLQAAKTITEGMKSLGFLQGNTEEIIAEGAHALFFPHGLGHPLGLDVHDMEGIGENYTGYEEGLVRSTQFGLKSLRLAKTLREGMVITVEPGIYFIPELISVWKSENKFKEFINYAAIEKMLPFGGIRIEDNVYVQQDRGLILGNPIPKSINEVEQIREIAYK
ncbi:MAG: Xaa-Pro dipeptidase, partial [Saprospiraceae bacterium]|nr:Xaa-Pro dipeptidase [Saprospiraceae bacterium]